MTTNPLLEGLTREDRSRLITRLAEAKPDQALALVQAVKDEALERCAADGWFWVNFVKTRDEADQESIKPFPQFPYLRELWNVIDGNQIVVIAKSRQMMASWLLAAYCVWFARFHQNKYVVWQTQKKEDANAMVCLPGVGEGGHAARMQFIERNLPTWMRLTPRESEGVLSYPNGSAIVALAGGANQIRGKTASLIVEDELAFQEEARGVFQAVAPLIQKATKFIAVSTPNGTSNLFSELYHGYVFGQNSD